MRNTRTNSSTPVRSCAEKLGESAVTESARSPRALCAAQARYAESAPPESATITDGSWPSCARSRVSFCSGERLEDSAARIGTEAVMRIQYSAEFGCCD